LKKRGQLAKTGFTTTLSKECPYMKGITHIAGGKQGLFEGFHEIQRFFMAAIAQNR
jgi:hypothetical protein